MTRARMSVTKAMSRAEKKNPFSYADEEVLEQSHKKRSFKHDIYQYNSRP